MTECWTGDPMNLQHRPELTLVEALPPLVVAAVFILLCALLREPNRRQFSAIMLAGAGAAYLGGGLGTWEFAFCAMMTFVAYRGLKDYRFIGTGWVLHTMWDIVHHLYGNPIVPFFPLSSAGCAICDLGLAAWYFAGAPSPYPWIARADRRVAKAE
jgi:hypothetical protein